MSDNIEDFIIEDGVLKKYVGKQSHVVIPDSVRVIGKSAFRDCKTVESVTIPESVTWIESEICSGGAFYNCAALTKIVIPPTVKEIPFECFCWCSKLKEVIFESEKIVLGECLFSMCTNLETIVFRGKDITPRFGNCVLGGRFGKVKIFIPKECYTENKRICANFAGYLAVEDETDIAGLWLYQRGKAWDEWFDTQCFDRDKIFAAMPEVLSKRKRVTAKQVERAQEFAQRYEDSMSDELIDEVFAELQKFEK